MEFKKLLYQGWRQKSTPGQLIKNTILLMLIIYILIELNGF